MDFLEEEEQDADDFFLGAMGSGARVSLSWLFRNEERGGKWRKRLAGDLPAQMNEISDDVFLLKLQECPYSICQLVVESVTLPGTCSIFGHLSQAVHI